MFGQFRSFDGGLQIADNVAAEDHKILLKGTPVLTPLMDGDVQPQPGRIFVIEPVVAAMKMVRANSER
ncbi:hypothetical protein WI81_03655 [Burkholderia ubonensis]|nr:hypothetical protein WI81_03655 [Burkholderia ubonensis]